MPKRDLRHTAVVITGASSGVGRAAALAFARRGARLALAARRGEALEEVAAECREAGAPAAIAVPTDVMNAGAVRHLADTAAERFGRIDVWVNNVGAFTETPVEAHDQVIRPNLMGYLHGAHAVLPYFLHRGRGVPPRCGSSRAIGAHWRSFSQNSSPIPKPSQRA
jgi:NAD(P)-dependent dehydrogenase (short-subunit alcohol dehydrogenase family)